MNQFSPKQYKLYANFMNTLAKDLTKYYYSKLNKTFKISNKLKGKGYDPCYNFRQSF
jgi:myo-inositol-1(or 4)-monophosphatase